MDDAGNLYGATDWGSNEAGNVFKLIPSGTGWTYISLHDFNGVSDGVSRWVTSCWTRMVISTELPYSAGHMATVSSGRSRHNRSFIG